eukprot:112015-Ditylum_brightwellii.AAC.1
MSGSGLDSGTDMVDVITKVDSATTDTVENEEEEEEETFTTAILLPTIEGNDAKPQSQLEKESQEQNLEPH